MAALLVLGVEVVSAQSDVVPGTPTSVATTSSNAEATVTWSAPIANGGTAVTGYSVAWASNAVQGMTSGSAVVAAATTTYRLTGLVNGVTYTFTVTATNAAGNGAASTSVAAVPYTRAGSPSNLVANALAGGQVNLTWSPPGDNGGSGFDRTTGSSDGWKGESGPSSSPTRRRRGPPIWLSGWIPPSRMSSRWRLGTLRA